MQRPLSSRRRRVGKREWSNDVTTFLDSGGLESLTKEKKDHDDDPPIDASEVRQRSSYAAAQRAFQVAQRQRKAVVERYQTQLERSRAIVSRTGETARPRNMSRAFARSQDDRHVIEHVVATRNDEYLEASAYVPQGYVADLSAMRSLPPERKVKTRTEKRVFYWG